MSAKEILTEQFTTCYDTNGWFVAVRNAVEGVTAEQAAWKPEGTNNSIWETLTHLSYYNNAYLQRFKGIEYKYDVDDNDATFTSGDVTEADWLAEVAKYDAIMTEFRKLLEAADESKFDENVPTKGDTKWAEIISLINTHNAYHAGQILLLRKLQGSWDRSKGVS